MRSRLSLGMLLGIVGTLALPLIAAAGVPYFGSIVPDAIKVCPAGWGAVILVINNLISFLITIAIIFVAPLMIAYAGFLFVVNPVNSSGISKAKEILTNTVVGIVIALCGYLIVDAVMGVLYNGNWTSIINWNSADGPCLPQAGALPGQGLVQAPTPGVVTGGVPSGNLVQCSASNIACSPSALQQAGFTATQANVMSCIAVTESSGNPSLPPYNIANPTSNSTACGLFQITQTTWSKNATGACSSFSSCTNAACNTQVAQALVSNHGYTDWTCAGCNSKAASCVQQYGG